MFSSSKTFEIASFLCCFYEKGSDRFSLERGAKIYVLIEMNFQWLSTIFKVLTKVLTVFIKNNVILEQVNINPERFHFSRKWMLLSEGRSQIPFFRVPRFLILDASQKVANDLRFLASDDPNFDSKKMSPARISKRLLGIVEIRIEQSAFWPRCWTFL